MRVATALIATCPTLPGRRRSAPFRRVAERGRRRRSPSDPGGHARSKRIHDAVAVRNHVEEVPGWRLTKPRQIERRRSRKASLHDDPVALAARSVAGGAEDLIALLSSREQVRRRGWRIGGPLFEREIAACDRSFGQRARRGAVTPDGGRSIGRIFLLTRHRDIVACAEAKTEHEDEKRSHASQAPIDIAPAANSARRARSSVSSSSARAMSRKNRSCVARSMPG